MRDKAIAGIGRVLLWNGCSLWIGRAAGLVQPHAHHAIQISLGLSGRLRFRTSAADDWFDYDAAIVLPHQRHQFDGCGGNVAQIFVEPESWQGRCLLGRYNGAPIVALPGEVIEPMVAGLRDAYAMQAANDELIAVGKAVLTGLCEGEPSSLPVDPRIARAIDFVRSRLHAPVTLSQAASVAHLSPSRFRHLFVAQTGISFRAYVLWSRVEAAVGAAMGGQSWTDAALNLGFADSAHLTRTCRRMFGIAPTMLIRE